MSNRARCPLCGGLAQVKTLVGGSRRHYTCETCTEYQITTFAQYRLRKTGDPGVLSHMAAAPGAGYTLVVTVDGDHVVGRPMKTKDLPT